MKCLNQTRTSIIQRARKIRLGWVLLVFMKSKHGSYLDSAPQNSNNSIPILCIAIFSDFFVLRLFLFFFFWIIQVFQISETRFGSYFPILFIPSQKPRFHMFTFIVVSYYYYFSFFSGL